MSIITVEKKVLEKNDLIASENKIMFSGKKLFVLNILSSPGSGKTSLIERTILNSTGKFSVGVIEGDVQTELDAERISKFNVPVVQIITNGACHLDANLVREAYRSLENHNFDVLFIENVGNLVCPAGYNLGEDFKITVLSTTEGDDKPLKYPSVFRNSYAMIINKIDLLPYLNSSIDTMKENAKKINPELKIFPTSCISDEGINDWCNWIESNIKPK